MTKKRLAWIDCAKGIGILLVVLAHTMSPVMTGHVMMQRIYKTIYWMAMPLFIVLLGIVSGSLVKANKEKWSLFGKRAQRMMVPYFTWAVIYLIMKAVLKDYMRFEPAPLWTIIIGNNPAGQLWYLYVAFVLLTVAIFLVNPQNLSVWCVGSAIVSFIAPLIPFSLKLPGIGLQYSLFQAGFFFLGLALVPHREKVFTHGWVALGCGIVWSVYAALMLCGIELWYLKCLSAACISYLIIFLVGKIPYGRIFDCLTYLGKNSMNIYVLHAPVILAGRVLIKPLLGGWPWLYVLVMTSGAVILSLLMSHFVLKRVKFLRFLLLGEKE